MSPAPGSLARVPHAGVVSGNPRNGAVVASWARRVASSCRSALCCGLFVLMCPLVSFRFVTWLLLFRGGVMCAGVVRCRVSSASAFVVGAACRCLWCLSSVLVLAGVCVCNGYLPCCRDFSSVGVGFVVVGLDLQGGSAHEDGSRTYIAGLPTRGVSPLVLYPLPS